MSKGNKNEQSGQTEGKGFNETNQDFKVLNKIMLKNSSIRSIKNKRVVNPAVALLAAAGILRLQAITITELFLLFLNFLSQHRWNKPSTIRARKYQLFGNHNNVSLIDHFNSIGIYTTEQITLPVLCRIRDLIEGSIKNINYQTTVKSGLARALYFGMENLYVYADHDFMSCLDQKIAYPTTITIPNEMQLDALINGNYGSNRLTALRDRIMFKIAGLDLGLRSAGEILSIDIDGLNINGYSITFIQKGGQEKRAFFRPDLVKEMLDYIELRDLFLTKVGCKSEKAFFIKDCLHRGICPSSGIRSYRLNKAGFWSAFRRLQKRNPVLSGLKPYDLRHYSVSISICLGIAFGQSLEEIAYNCGHTVKTLLTYYNAVISRYRFFKGTTLQHSVQIIKDSIVNKVTPFGDALTEEMITHLKHVLGVLSLENACVKALAAQAA